MKRAHGIGTISALVTLLAASTAWSQPDAGARSVFAYGAGNRALGLGGAYTGVADDASAALWNPAGLGSVSRMTFGASHAALYGLGFDDQYASVVLPHWRLGAFAISLQRFAVDGIHVRDGRNVSLDDNASSSQTQLTFAYGRALGRAWNFGGAMKFQRHAIVDATDGGIGIDLGVLFRPGTTSGRPWLQPLTLGLAVRNALEPTVRLDQDEVSDPLGARLGLGYRLTPGNGQSMLLALDLDKTTGVGLEVHAGAEYTPHPLLALRLGFNDGRLAAGSSVRWSDASFDYVFESNRIEPVHRVGATLRFGASVEESRLAAQRSREAQIEARLAQAYQERREQRLAQLMRVAQTAHLEGRFEAALQMVGTIETLSPDNAQAQELKLACLLEYASALESNRDYVNAGLTYAKVLAIRPGEPAALAGQERTRLASDRLAQRSSAIRAQFTEALHAFGAEDFIKARDGFLKVLELNPDDADALAMLKRTRDAIDLRIRNLMNLARLFLEGDNPVDATPLLDQVRTLDPATPDLEVLAQRSRTLTQRRQTEVHEDTTPRQAVQAQAPEAASLAADLAAAQRREAERKEEAAALYARALEAMRQGRSDEALRYWELVWAMDPTHEKVVEHLKREYLMRGMESFATGDLTVAITVWKKALNVDPSDERVLGYLTRAQEQLARTQEILGKTQK